MSPDPADGDPTDRLAALIAVWVADIDAEPIPELVDVDTAVSIVRGEITEGAEDER